MINFQRNAGLRLLFAGETAQLGNAFKHRDPLPRSALLV